MERVKEERGQTRHGGDMTRRPNTVASTDQRGYRIVEAAEYMGVTPWFVEVKIRSGELPALKLCRHYTILKQDMDTFLDRQRAALLDKHRSSPTQRSEEHTSELQSRLHLVCRLLLEKKKTNDLLRLKTVQLPDAMVLMNYQVTAPPLCKRHERASTCSQLTRPPPAKDAPIR